MLAQARAQEDRAQIEHYNRRYEREGHLDAQARSDMRVDQTIAALLEAREAHGGGGTRSELLAQRRRPMGLCIWRPSLEAHATFCP